MLRRTYRRRRTQEQAESYRQIRSSVAFPFRVIKGKPETSFLVAVFLSSGSESKNRQCFGLAFLGWFAVQDRWATAIFQACCLYFQADQSGSIRDVCCIDGDEGSYSRKPKERHCSLPPIRYRNHRIPCRFVWKNSWDVLQAACKDEIL